MAEGILRKLAPQVKTFSAGTAANPAYRIFGGLKEILDEESVSYEGHVSTPVTGDILSSFDILLVMEDSHKEILLKLFPGSAGKIFLLTEFAGETGNIADPIGLPKKEYRRTFKRIEDLIKKIIPGKQEI